MDNVILHGGIPTLHRPALVAAFEGWNDAGEAASRAVAQIGSAIGAHEFAHVDAEEFFDFQIVRPSVRLAAEGRVLDWPGTRFSHGGLGAGDRHVVLLEGAEPNLRWRTFTDGVVDFAARLGVELVVTVGALQTDTPHTCPVPLTASSADTQVVDAFALQPSTYEGPTGIVGVLHDAFARAAVPAISLWAGVPHYLAGSTYLPAALRLADEVSRLLAADIPLASLAEEAAGQADDIATLVSEDADLADYVEELERRAVAQPEERPLATGGVSGEELAAELERFLRGRGEA